MESWEIAQKVAESLCAGTEVEKRERLRGSNQHGINTENMVEVALSLPIGTKIGKNNDLLSALQIFPEDDGSDFGSPSLNAEGDLILSVYFPTPYRSAEKFYDNERSQFIGKMARYKIALRIRPYLNSKLRNKLLSKHPDPRHPDEIKWEKHRQAVKDFFNRLIPKKRSKPKRTFNEYL